MGTYLVMKNNFRRSFRHKLLFIITFLLPVTLCILLGLVNFNKSTVRVGILTDYQTNTTVMERVYELLDHSKGIRYANVDEVSLNTDLMTGKYHVVLDYRESKKIDEYQLISYQKRAKIDLIKKVFNQALIMNKPMELSAMKKEGLSATERTMAMLLSLFLIFSTVYTSLMIRDRESGIIQRYQFARRSSSGYILGYLLHCFLIIFAQILLCMALLLVLQKNFTPTALQGFVMAVVIAAISALFGLLISMFCKSEVQANITASALAAVMSLLGGTFVAVAAMPGLLRILSYTSPIRWVVELLSVIP